jgi:hypothetical protein
MVFDNPFDAYSQEDKRKCQRPPGAGFLQLRQLENVMFPLPEPRMTNRFGHSIPEFTKGDTELLDLTSHDCRVINRRCRLV